MSHTFRIDEETRKEGVSLSLIVPTRVQDKYSIGAPTDYYTTYLSFSNDQLVSELRYINDQLNNKDSNTLNDCKLRLNAISRALEFKSHDTIELKLASVKLLAASKMLSEDSKIESIENARTYIEDVSTRIDTYQQNEYMKHFSQNIKTVRNQIRGELEGLNFSPELKEKAIAYWENQYDAIVSDKNFNTMKEKANNFIQLTDCIISIGSLDAEAREYILPYFEQGLEEQDYGLIYKSRLMGEIHLLVYNNPLSNLTDEQKQKIQEILGLSVFPDQYFINLFENTSPGLLPISELENFYENLDFETRVIIAVTNSLDNNYSESAELFVRAYNSKDRDLYMRGLLSTEYDTTIGQFIELSRELGYTESEIQSVLDKAYELKKEIPGAGNERYNDLFFELDVLKYLTLVMAYQIELNQVKPDFKVIIDNLKQLGSDGEKIADNLTDVFNIYNNSIQNSYDMLQINGTVDEQLYMARLQLYTSIETAQNTIENFRQIQRAELEGLILLTHIEQDAGIHDFFPPVSTIQSTLPDNSLDSVGFSTTQTRTTTRDYLSMLDPLSFIRGKQNDQTTPQDQLEEFKRTRFPYPSPEQVKSSQLPDVVRNDFENTTYYYNLSQKQDEKDKQVIEEFEKATTPLERQKIILTQRIERIFERDLKLNRPMNENSVFLRHMSLDIGPYIEEWKDMIDSAKSLADLGDIYFQISKQASMLSVMKPMLIEAGEGQINISIPRTSVYVQAILDSKNSEELQDNINKAMAVLKLAAELKSISTVLNQNRQEDASYEIEKMLNDLLLYGNVGGSGSFIDPRNELVLSGKLSDISIAFLVMGDSFSDSEINDILHAVHLSLNAMGGSSEQKTNAIEAFNVWSEKRQAAESAFYASDNPYANRWSQILGGKYSRFIPFWNPELYSYLASDKNNIYWSPHPIYDRFNDEWTESAFSGFINDPKTQGLMVASSFLGGAVAYKGVQVLSLASRFSQGFYLGRAALLGSKYAVDSFRYENPAYFFNWNTLVLAGQTMLMATPMLRPSGGYLTRGIENELSQRTALRWFLNVAPVSTASTKSVASNLLADGLRLTDMAMSAYYLSRTGYRVVDFISGGETTLGDVLLDVAYASYAGMKVTGRMPYINVTPYTGGDAVFRFRNPDTGGFGFKFAPRAITLDYGITNSRFHRRHVYNVQTDVFRSKESGVDAVQGYSSEAYSTNTFLRNFVGLNEDQLYKLSIVFSDGASTKNLNDRLIREEPDLVLGRIVESSNNFVSGLEGYNKPLTMVSGEEVFGLYLISDVSRARDIVNNAPTYRTNLLNDPLLQRSSQTFSVRGKHGLLDIPYERTSIVVFDPKAVIEGRSNPADLASVADRMHNVEKNIWKPIGEMTRRVNLQGQEMYEFQLRIYDNARNGVNFNNLTDDIRSSISETQYNALSNEIVIIRNNLIKAGASDNLVDRFLTGISGSILYVENYAVARDFLERYEPVPQFRADQFIKVEPVMKDLNNSAEASSKTGKRTLVVNGKTVSLDSGGPNKDFQNTLKDGDVVMLLDLDIDHNFKIGKSNVQFGGTRTLKTANSATGYTEANKIVITHIAHAVYSEASKIDPDVQISFNGTKILVKFSSAGLGERPVTSFISNVEQNIANNFEIDRGHIMLHGSSIVCTGDAANDLTLLHEGFKISQNNRDFRGNNRSFLVIDRNALTSIYTNSEISRVLSNQLTSLADEVRNFGEGVIRNEDRAMLDILLGADGANRFLETVRSNNSVINLLYGEIYDRNANSLIDWGQFNQIVLNNGGMPNWYENHVYTAQNRNLPTDVRALIGTPSEISSALGALFPQTK
ncbi:hypothetical protein KO465_03705 [Candidatus Micrarchaeota archaeon]|nr:hypothetical protein [Candidatus Micrarchaeota archaeon]